MFDNYQICPYTGLRSFSEEESLYFKGREDDIEQATGQLQKNKFLMLTGASGDGKSSLVYAGIIPNARAGFLKSKYTNWCVAAFRPERTPFQNLATALSKQLDIPGAYTVQGELSHGFSALVDLYRNSKRYVDTQSESWIRADDKEKAVLKREAANLIILVDQFEELFTNPENYQQGVPSRDANLVLNLLLETARISLEEDIPIYVVFTMRSDYIGQCAAFRGLPEYIGFSQFFVPRLNRSQLQQVIEEPASLSGNRIARRLTERLIHDLTEGVDQLPILQHALKQIWIAADSGNEEMDLVHYAMVGGMSVNELPDDQVERFNDWFSGLTPAIKACYHAPSLQNVLDTHTNKLYEQAAGYYQSETGKPMPDEDAKVIIRTAFTCLTKIDQSRAVRNRMTLQEITNILGNPDYDYQTVGAVLNIFREPGNTFINPFISEENPESRKPDPDAVYDITHESLIRNWQYLGQWAREEYDSYSVSLDFEKQLDRWVKSGKSDNYLLSIGPLTYFESWYNKARPNAWWIARYLPEENDNESRLGNAKGILNNSREFIQRSSRKHIITRTIMRYGPRRIAAVIGILALLVLSSFTIRNYIRQQNGFVLEKMRGQLVKAAADPNVLSLDKGSAVSEGLMSGLLSLEDLVGGIPDTLQRLKTFNGINSNLVFQGMGEPSRTIISSLTLVDSLMAAIPYPQNDPRKMSAILNEINLARVVLEIADYYRPDARIDSLRKKNGIRSAQWVTRILTEQPAGFTDIPNLALAMENGINLKVFSGEDLDRLIKILSPLEPGLSSEWLKANFQKDKILIRGSEGLGYGFKYNGLYQELAYLYAATGQTGKVLICLDSLLANNQSYFQGDYAAGGDNAYNIAAVFFMNNNLSGLDDFVKGYCTRKSVTQEDFYSRMIGRTLHNFEATNNLRLYPFMDQTSNLNLRFSGWRQLSMYYNKYRDIVRTSMPDKNQRNYLLALSYKNEGVQKSINREELQNGDLTPEGYFDSALILYRSLDPKFLQAQIPVSETSLDVKMMPRSYLFVYPDLKTQFEPGEPRAFFVFYFSDVFLQYIVNHQLVNSFYPGSEELSYLNEWMEEYNTIKINPPGFGSRNIRFGIIRKLEESLDKRDLSKANHLNWMYLYLGKDAQDSGMLDLMVNYYDKVEPSNIFYLLHQSSFFGFVRDQSFRLISFAVEGYTKAGKPEKAQRLVKKFKNPVNRSSLYSYAALQLIREHGDPKKYRPLLDSALAEMDRKENRTNQQPNRGLLAYALAMENPSGNLAKSYSLIRNLPSKFEANSNICRSFGFHHELYNALANSPENISAVDYTDILWFTLMGYREGDGTTINPEWKQYIEYYVPRFSINITYIDENN